MSFLKIFYPDEYRDSTYSLDFQKYYDMGYRGILFDIDNTLVPHGAPATKESVELFEKLRSIGFKTCLISNNQKPRVTPFAKAMKTEYIYNAHKPSRKNYRKAFDVMGTKQEETMFVGDQIFTDVFGAKRVGMYSILVKPIHPKEEIQIVLKRYLEKIVLKSYRRYKNKNIKL
ncbi:MAG: YqeG family HAD IIIA-type phosphatase [Lachnospiraceae bacterium]|nr:YqeG family HAD IIIA-type phosphatase [Lachnospiraceae bacterium]